MSSMKVIAPALLALLLQGCATLPSPETMKAEVQDFQLPKLHVEGKAIVYVVRPSEVGGLTRFNVFLNDQQPESEMGFTRGSQYIYFQIPPGQHKIQSKAENWSEWIVNAKAGDILFIQQDAGMGLLMARNTLLKINDVEGRYHVKTLKLGTIHKIDK